MYKLKQSRVLTGSFSTNNTTSWLAFFCLLFFCEWTGSVWYFEDSSDWQAFWQQRVFDPIMRWFHEVTRKLLIVFSSLELLGVLLKNRWHKEHKRTNYRAIRWLTGLASLGILILVYWPDVLPLLLHTTDTLIIELLLLTGAFALMQSRSSFTREIVTTVDLLAADLFAELSKVRQANKHA